MLLNVYKYFDEPESLPHYHGIHDKFALINKWHSWGDEISVEELKPLLGIIKRNPEYAFLYARGVMRSRWIEAEPAIMTHPTYAEWYAEFVLAKDPEWTSIKGHENGRWPEAENYIMKDPYQAYMYAKNVIKDRWIEAEPHIEKSADDWWKYNQIFKIS